MAIIVFAIGTGLFFVQTKLEATIENDMSVVADIADRLVTREIDLLKADALTAARTISEAGDENLQTSLREQVEANDAFIGMTVIDYDGVVASYGNEALPESIARSEYIAQAFNGESVISTTRIDSQGNAVFHVCVPMDERVLSVTIPGDFFSSIVADFRIWETGNIFILDKDGTVVANVPPELVDERFNAILESKRDADYADIAQTTARMIQQETGVGRYTMYEKERLCIYQPITGSKVGWSLGVVAPIEESPIASVRFGLLLVGLISLILSIIAAFPASRNLARPYAKNDELIVSLTAAEEEARASAAAKSDFLANMSHEMRTPLNAIIGLSELTLDSGEINETPKENLEKVYNSGVTLLSLINDILDISKIESGKFELVPVEYDTPSLINDTVTLNIVRIGSKLITFELDVDETLPHMLLGDELRVKQIFNNLLSNAFKYTKEGTVTWSISYEHDGGDFWLVSSVKDSGVGIRPEDLEKLFSEYNQVDTKSNRKIEGTGLGLSICKSMVELMDGTITVASEYGEGSTFTVRIKQGLVDKDAIGPEVVATLKSFNYSMNKRDRSAKLIRAHLPYARVLIVDDVPTNLDVAKGMMKPYGMQIDCVTSGSAAIKLIRTAEVKYQAIFMDHMMPEMDGIEATRIIREEIGTEYARTVPIIALTANAIVGNDEMFLQNGFQAFLSKPIDIMRMDAEINQWVRDKDLEKKLAAEGWTDQFEDKRRGGERRHNDKDRRGGFDRRQRSQYDGFAGRFKDAAVDIEQGLGFFGGDEEIYLGVLRSYVQNTPPLLDQVRNYSKETLPDYAIVVHGIKSSSRSIGSEQVGSLAEELEYAAKAGDFSSVEAKTSELVALVENLVEHLAAVLQEFEAENPKPLKAEPDEALLARLLEACKSIDIDEVDAAIEELDSYDYESGGDLVEWLKDRVNVTDFTQIVARLSA
jgi:signal transduction histidine kinase/DNA-binding NarL/FixJ family response regulator/HPt (histidine-containing phosphotransfer) domain-containing protein